MLVSEPVFAVADGMGGHRGGETASATVVESLAEIRSLASLDELVSGIQEANERIMSRASQDPGLHGMGTTITVLASLSGAGPSRLGVANVGDSRLYRLTEDGLHQHTEDHSLVETLVRQGSLSAAEAAVHPQRNVITRALGVDEGALVDSWELVPVVGDRYLICSDGLFGEIGNPEIHDVLSELADVQAAAEELVERACAAGGRDNVTVVVVDIVEADAVADLPADRVSDVRLALPDEVPKPQRRRRRRRSAR